MTSRALDWQAQAKEVFSIGGVRATDVDHMLTEAQGFMWTWLAGDVQGLEARLKDARAWCTKVCVGCGGNGCVSGGDMHVVDVCNGCICTCVVVCL